MTMTYDRSRTASFSRFTSYGDTLEAIQSEFVTAAGSVLHDYLKALHGRLRDEQTGWTYGSAEGRVPGEFVIRVWLQQTARLPNGLAGNLTIKCAFQGGKVEVTFMDDNRHRLAVKTLSEKSASPSTIGMWCSEVWEKLVTGSVDYGD